MTTVVASRIVFEDKVNRLRVRYEYGVYTLESGAKKGAVTSVQLSPEAMDALAAAWPAWKASL
jgi:hypothetical protein